MGSLRLHVPAGAGRVQSYSKPQVWAQFWEHAEKPTVAIQPPIPVWMAPLTNASSRVHGNKHTAGQRKGGSKSSLHHSDLEQFTSFRGPHQQKRVPTMTHPCLYIKLKGGHTPIPFLLQIAIFNLPSWVISLNKQDAGRDPLR